MGYEVTLATDVFEPETVDRIFGMGTVLKGCSHLPLPNVDPFKPNMWLRFSTVQRLLYDCTYARKVNRILKNFESDVVFSTQPSIFTIKSNLVFQFVYDVIDLYSYSGSFHSSTGGRETGTRKRAYYLISWRARKALVGNPQKPKLFLALSENLRRDLSRFGYFDSIRVYPPCRLEFEPLEKQKTVVTVCRITPEKRLEMFVDIAKMLPGYRFYIIARDSEEQRKASPGYFERVFADLPDNVSYLNFALKEVSAILQTSKVYLYCGNEAGVGIAVMEAAGAGCIPVAFEKSGCGEALKGLEIGYSFLTIEEAALKTRRALEDSLWNPTDIRVKAERLFGPEKFEQTIKGLVQIS